MLSQANEDNKLPADYYLKRNRLQQYTPPPPAPAAEPAGSIQVALSPNLQPATYQPLTLTQPQPQTSVDGIMEQMHA